jgi:hypothetical protein
MINPETQATLGTRHRIKRYKTTTTKNTIRRLTLKQRGPLQNKENSGVDPGAGEW